MTHLKNLAAVAALALFGLTSANAATSYVPMDPGSPGNFTNTWTFASPAGRHAQGSSFDDYFTFNVPDSETISFEVDSSVSGGTFGVSFDGFALYEYADGTLLDLDLTGGSSISGGLYTLTSGTYQLEVAGTYLSRTGTYGGVITGNTIAAAVPEPANLALMLAGLGVMGVVARRRSNAKA